VLQIGPYDIKWHYEIPAVGEVPALPLLVLHDRLILLRYAANQRPHEQPDEPSGSPVVLQVQHAEEMRRGVALRSAAESDPDNALRSVTIFDLRYPQSREVGPLSGTGSLEKLVKNAGLSCLSLVVNVEAVARRPQRYLHWPSYLCAPHQSRVNRVGVERIEEILLNVKDRCLPSGLPQEPSV